MTSSPNPAQFGSQMNIVRAYRKLKEEEETKLANRLHLLKLQLEKSKRKIAKTNERTDSIVTHRQAVEQRNRAMIEAAERKAAEQRAKAEARAAKRKELAAQRRKAMTDVYARKKATVQQVKNERERIQQEVERQRRIDARKAKERRAKVRAQRDAGKASRIGVMERKARAARREIRNKLVSEAQRSKQLERRVENMEAEELRLIKELEDVQAQQRQAYEQLEEALEQGPPRIKVQTISERYRLTDVPHNNSSGGKHSRKGGRKKTGSHRKATKAKTSRRHGKSGSVRRNVVRARGSVSSTNGRVKQSDTPSGGLGAPDEEKVDDEEKQQELVAFASTLSPQGHQTSEQVQADESHVASAGNTGGANHTHTHSTPIGQTDNDAGTDQQVTATDVTEQPADDDEKGGSPSSVPAELAKPDESAGNSRQQLADDVKAADSAVPVEDTSPDEAAGNSRQQLADEVKVQAAVKAADSTAPADEHAVPADTGSSDMAGSSDTAKTETESLTGTVAKDNVATPGSHDILTVPVSSGAQPAKDADAEDAYEQDFNTPVPSEHGDAAQQSQHVQ